MTEGNGSTGPMHWEYRGQDGVLTDPRRVAYRLVADLVARHLREYHVIQGELRVQLQRIEEAMRNASSIDQR